MTESLNGFRMVLNRDVLAHNPEVAGSNPAPATMRFSHFASVHSDQPVSAACCLLVTTGTNLASKAR